MNFSQTAPGIRVFRKRLGGMHEALRRSNRERRMANKLPPGFRAIPGFSVRYGVSRAGVVFSRFSGGVLKYQINNGWYPTVTLSNGVRKRPYEIHALVMLSFRGPPPSGMEVDHKNRIKTDCRLTNLWYVRRGFNIHNAEKPHRHGSVFRGLTTSPRASGPVWYARICYNYTKVARGPFLTDREAALAYDRMALANFGRSALTNKKLGLL